MNSCPDRELLNLYFLNLLDENVKREIEEHLRGCEKCYKEYEIEREIRKNFCQAIEAGDIEEKVIKRLRIFNYLPEYHLFKKFFYTFIFSSILIASFLFLWQAVSGMDLKDLSYFKSEEFRTLTNLYYFYLREISRILFSEKMNYYYITVTSLFFLFNFLYALRKYFSGKGFI